MPRFAKHVCQRWARPAPIIEPASRSQTLDQWVTKPREELAIPGVVNIILVQLVLGQLRFAIGKLRWINKRGLAYLAAPVVTAFEQRKMPTLRFQANRTRWC